MEARGVHTEPDADEQVGQTTAEVATPLPFWATKDKQARLERLRATAIEVPEPEVVQPAAVGAKAEAAQRSTGNSWPGF